MQSNLMHTKRKTKLMSNMISAGANDASEAHGRFNYRHVALGGRWTPISG